MPVSGSGVMLVANTVPNGVVERAAAGQRTATDRRYGSRRSCRASRGPRPRRRGSDRTSRAAGGVILSISGCQASAKAAATSPRRTRAQSPPRAAPPRVKSGSSDFRTITPRARGRVRPFWSRTGETAATSCRSCSNGALVRPLVGPPAHEARAVAEAVAGDVVVLHFGDQLELQRLPLRAALGRPAARSARCIAGEIRARPSSASTLRVSAGRSLVGDARGEADMVELALVVEQAEQQRADQPCCSVA